ncbi:MAG: 1,4-dihydroxy-2-naphthoate octaprenyltransferase, partial [Bacteroidota bacterium]|nr:1,4-dihydroxy-2-naphthoate octaprenyltransferase [Bacteroidota bacterium]
MQRIGKWFNTIRPKTLIISLVPIVIGIIYAGLTTSINFLVAIATVLCGISLQALSNLINDYYDYKKGTDKEDIMGNKRALAQGKISLSQMKKIIFINLILTSLLGIYLVYMGGLPILVIGLLSIFFAWLYTATPYALAYLGIADIFAFLFYGVVASCGTYYLLCMDMVLIKRVVAAGCTCGCIATMVLTVNNLRDIDTDKLHSKKSFEVRFGKKAGEIKYLLLTIM